MGRKIMILVVCAFAAVAHVAHAQNFLVNGSFEAATPLVPPDSFNSGLSPTTGVPGWTSSATGVNFFEIWSNTVNGIPASAGTNQLEINAKSADQTVSQAVTNLTIGRPTTFCFDYTGRNGAAGDPPTPNNDFTVALSGGVTIGPVSLDPSAYTAAGGWQHFCTNFIPRTSTVTITFRGLPHVAVASGAHIDNVSLTQSPRPTVTIEPDGQTVCVGQNVTFTASGEGSYAWTGPNGFKANTAAFTLTKVTAAMAGSYTVIVTGTGGGTATASVTLAVSALPVAAIATGDRTVCAGQDVPFTASGGTSYVWTGPNGFKANTAAFTLTKVTAAMAGSYTVIVTGAGGCTATASVTLAVSALPVLTCPPTITTNGSGTGVVVRFADPKVTGGTLQSCVPASGSVFPLGTTFVTCSATNACGTTTCTFDVTVVAGEQEASPCDRTSMGRGFWLTFPANYAPDPANRPQLSLHLAGRANVSGQVSIPGLAFVAHWTIPASGVTTVDLPWQADLGSLNDGVTNKGIRVTATDKIAVYAMNHVSFTSDAYLGLPDGMLGTNYIVLAYPNVITGVPELNGSEFAIVATEDNTAVTIKPRVTTGGHAAGVPFTVPMNRGTTYQLINTDNAPNDLTGTVISADKPIGVFSGHRSANIPRADRFFSDTVVEQLLPTADWGTNFVAMPLATRIGGDTYRIVAAEANTSVRLNGNVIATLNGGEVYEQIVMGPAHVTSDKGILVAQFANSSDFDSVAKSDPFMVLVPPTNLFLDEYLVFSMTNGFASHYLNIVVSSMTAAIILDGNPISQSSFSQIPSAGPASGFYGAQVSVTPGKHLLTTPSPVSQRFGVIVYGFGEYVSYGYPAGMGFACSNKCFSIRCPDNIVVHSTDAIGQRVTFQVPATNACGGKVAVMCNPPSGSVFPFGTTVVQCEAGDPTGGTGSTVSCSFTVTVARTPTISPVVLAGDRLSFSLPTDAGVTFYVEYTTMLTQPNWILLRTIVGDGSVVPVTDPVAKEARFYRVRKE